jgi:hypothetical protein
MNDLSAGTILLGVLFGSLGVGYFIYGRKQREGLCLFVGVALMVVPYFITNVWALLAVCTALASAPFVARRWF